MTPEQKAAHKAIFDAYLAILLSLDTTTRAGCLRWARVAIQARRESIKAGLADVTTNYIATAAYARDRARELSNPKPFDAGRFRVVMEREGATSAAIERCLDLARRETCAELPSFRGERGAA